MKKLNKELYEQHAKRIEVIVRHQSPFSIYLKRKDFSFIVESQLNILNVLEHKFDDSKIDKKFKVNNLVKLYNGSTGSKFQINDQFKLDDDVDYLDSMNYLVTYCKNIFKVDIDELVSGKQTTVEQPVSPINQSNVENINEAAAGAGAFGSMFSMGAEYMDPRQNPFILSQASVQLQKEMSEGKFYRYKTKPRAIPVIKWVGAILIILTCLSLILMAVFAFLTNNAKVIVEGSSDPVLFSTITDGIFFILFAGLGVYNLVVFFKSILSKNENQIYYFQWQVLLIFIIGAIMAVLFGIDGVFLVEYSVPDLTNIQKLGIQMWKVFWFMSISSVGLCLVPIILASIFNPKVDTAAIDKRLNQIVEQLTSNYGVFKKPTADVQKPVDVKKPRKSKKDSTDKKE